MAGYVQGEFFKLCTTFGAIGRSLSYFRFSDEPRKIIDEIKRIKLTDVILPTKNGVEIKLHCVSKPDEHQQILLQHLGLTLPSRLTKNHKM